MDVKKIMPIYEYQCRLCQHSLESLQKMSDEPLVHCPACDQPGLQRLVSAAGFQLKGQGWYATDFKEKAKPSESKTEALSGTAVETQTETKSAATSEA